MPVAKNTKKRSSKNFVAIPFSGSLPLVTLASEALLSGDVFPGVLTEDFYAISVDLNAQILALTAGEGDPMSCGFAHGDYTDPQIEENLEVSFLGPGSKIAQERARRLVRNTGIFASETVGHTSMKLYGRTGVGNIRTKLKFVVNSNKNLSIWVLNKSGAALTTGSNLRFQGTVYGRWII